MLASQRAAPAGPRVIEEGSLVVVYENRQSMKCVAVKPGAQYNSRFGNFKPEEWMGLPFGSKVFDKRGKGFVHLLEVTPELWTRLLLHRTQILYLPDISMVCAHMELRPGSVVLESGTGSGSLTTSLARAVAPTGRVYTFEYHEQRAATARAEFLQNGLSGVITVFVRDTMATGFPAALRGHADGVFLDLPGPHQVAKSAVESLRPNGWVCSFSPCIEQVQRMCLALAEQGMVELRTVEVLDREYDIVRKQARTLGEGAADPARGKGKKRGRDDAAPAGAAAAVGGGGDAAGGAGAAAAPAGAPERVQAFPQDAARGHTGYLTFARKPVYPAAGVARAGAGAGAEAGGEGEEDEEDAAGEGGDA